MRAGAKGIKVQCSGRLAGAEMARTETYREGRVPLTTLRADVDYGFFESKTKYGRIGCKVWIYKGEILPLREEERIRQAAVERQRRRQRRAPRGPEQQAAPEAAVATEAAPPEQPEQQKEPAPEQPGPPTETQGES
jgi:small subunit ribosomal protein S3